MGSHATPSDSRRCDPISQLVVAVPVRSSSSFRVGSIMITNLEIGCSAVTNAINISPETEILRPDGTLECGRLGYGDIEDCKFDAVGAHSVVVTGRLWKQDGFVRPAARATINFIRHM
jgi:hypothetical protein